MESDIAALLRDDFEREMEAGFPLLGRSPQTKVIQFLDYFASISAKQQSALLEALAARGAVLFKLDAGSSFPSIPAFDLYWDTVTSPGPFTGGYRYCDVKFLESVPKVKEFGSYDAWIENYQKPWVSELALTPREDLLPRKENLKAAKGRFLGKLVKKELVKRGFEARTTRGAEHRYKGPAGDSIQIDFGSYSGQLCYGITSIRGNTKVYRLSYEYLWSQPGGWDYITEENASRCVNLLPTITEYLTTLTERIADLESS